LIARRRASSAALPSKAAPYRAQDPPSPAEPSSRDDVEVDQVADHLATYLFKRAKIRSHSPPFYCHDDRFG